MALLGTMLTTRPGRAGGGRDADESNQDQLPHLPL